ncbi:putative permease [Sporotomaculum syntrophicum]|uniref:Permease n=2 Tax=Sporotomaculum syntrophicum TaxID=182264 RepID=A0A9D2WQ56_9FIRM|nr:putative permease [Sporotomaculum syntrophicum]
MSFLIASPLLNPVIIALFLSLLGIKVTAAYAAITFIVAVFIGMLWEKMGLADQYKKVYIQKGAGTAGEMSVLDLTVEPEPDTMKIKFKRAGEAAWSLFRQVFLYLMLGAAIGAFIYGFVPDSLIMKWAGPGNPLAVPAAALIGIPMYIRAETIIPISAVLIGKGMSIGAVIALIIGGAGASIPEVIILASIFRRKLIIAFVVTIVTVAILAGYLFNLIF